MSKIPKLKVQKKKVIEVSDWDDLVTKVYGRPYNLQQQNGCVARQMMEIEVPCECAEDFENDTVPEIVNHRKMGVSFKAWLERDPKQKLDKSEFGNDFTDTWWERNFYPNLDTVINDLHAKGYLEAGEYSIDIDW